MKISAVIITKNEELSIERTLRSLWWCDEIVVVDSFSTDGTVSICRNYTDNVHLNDFYGFGTQKQIAVSWARNDWILSIDADEVVSDELRNEIELLLKEPVAQCGFHIPFQMFFLGKAMHCRHGNESKLRLFDRRHGKFNSNVIHEYVEVSGLIGHLKTPIHHYSYETISEYLEKFNQYTGQASRDIYARKKAKSIVFVALRIPFEFMRRYIFQFGIVDGVHGFIWSFLSACYPLVKYFKVWELAGRQNSIVDVPLKKGNVSNNSAKLA